MRAEVPSRQRLPVIQRRVVAGLAGRAFYPAALPLGLVLVGRVADDHRDGLLALHAVGGLALLADGGGKAREAATVVVGVAQSVGNVHSWCDLRYRPRQGHHLGQQPQLRHGERAQLELERHHTPQRRLHGGRYRTRPFVVSNARRQMAQHA